MNSSQMSSRGQQATLRPTGNIKAWYEAIGLKAGPMLPPIKNLSEEQKEKVKEAVRKIGVV